MIAIIHYSVGNVGAIKNILKKCGAESIITSDKNVIASAEKIIFPGVGNFDVAITKLKELDIIDVLNYKVLEEKTPILGICLGMQILTNRSDEGTLKGFGWINAETVKIPKIENLKIPQMGWNYVKLKSPSKIFCEMPENFKFYFVHSYYVKCQDNQNLTSVCDYGSEITASIEKENIVGVQFHPEKSHKFGKKIIENFLKFY